MSLAWADHFDPGRLLPAPSLGLPGLTPEWAWGGSTGAGVKVAVIDSGIDADHPAVGSVAGGVVLEYDQSEADGVRVTEMPHGDLYGHGTACAAIIRSLAPDVELYSVRVLGERLTGKARVFARGIEWCIENGIQVANLSLSTSNEDWFATFHELADDAAFKRMCLVCALNNEADKPTYPSQFSSVFSVAAHPIRDPESISYNPDGPPEFGAHGYDVDVAWSGGGRIVATGNSFATPHVAGLVARILSKRPDLSCFQVKTVLAGVAANSP